MQGNNTVVFILTVKFMLSVDMMVKTKEWLVVKLMIFLEKNGKALKD